MSATLKAVIAGLSAAAALLVLYFGLVSFVSGREFAGAQFARFWYFIVALEVGFGVQVGLYAYLRFALRGTGGTGTVAISGTTSTVAMVSCCSHYFVSLLPIVAASGVAAVVGQYQVELFWVGLTFNAAGVIYILRRVIRRLPNTE